MAAIDRRRVLRGTAFTTLLTVVGVSALRAKAAPSERVRVGCVGVGRRAGGIMRAFAGLPEVEVVTRRDLDSRL